MSPSSDICVLCSTHVENIVMCENCGPLAYYCDECCERNECCERILGPMLFHKPKRWTVSIILWYTNCEHMYLVCTLHVMECIVSVILWLD